MIQTTPRASPGNSLWGTPAATAFSWYPSWKGATWCASSALALRRAWRGESMKKAALRRPRETDGLRQEYEFDYSKSKPNRFASQLAPESVAVLLDPDVAAVFQDAAALNAFLRSLIDALPTTKPKTARKG